MPDTAAWRDVERWRKAERERLMKRRGLFRSKPGGGESPATGIGYPCSRIGTICPQPHDIAMDIVITG